MITGNALKKFSFYSFLILFAGSLSTPILADCTQPQLATYSNETRLVSIPTVQLPTGECFNATLELMPEGPGMVFVLKSATPYPPPGGGSNPPPGGDPNKSKTEQLIGAWEFKYTIISTWTDQYYLSGEAFESTSSPGVYYVSGTDKWDDLVVAGYDPDLQQYTLFDSGSTIDQFYTFDLPSPETAQGCYYLITKSTGEMSNCYPMTGKRLPPRTSTTAANTQDTMVGDHRSPEEIEAELVEQNALFTDLATRYQQRNATAQSMADNGSDAYAQYQALRDAADQLREISGD